MIQQSIFMFGDCNTGESMGAKLFSADGLACIDCMCMLVQTAGLIQWV